MVRVETCDGLGFSNVILAGDACPYYGCTYIVFNERIILSVYKEVCITFRKTAIGGGGVATTAYAS